MSETLRNEDFKRAELKKIIGRLHNGESAAMVKKEFTALIKNVSAEEIVSMEQALMEEGLPVEEIQRLCEVHIAVFQTSLEKRGRPEKVSGHPIHTYMAENKAAKAALKKLSAAARPLALTWTRDQAALGLFDVALQNFSELLIHYTRKENQLFPFLEAKGFVAPSKVMWAKHDEIRALFKEAEKLRKTADWKKLRRALSLLSSKVKKMFFMEEHILLPEAVRRLSEKDWVAVRRGEGAIGYAWIKPGDEWDPDIAEAKRAAQPSPADTAASPNKPELTKQAEPADMPGALRLGEGWLTREQIDLMLKALPLDISFVDEHDRVLYYSDNAERLFPRSPAIIGRNVANCHPPKSVHIVKRIVEAFRAKTKNFAEFWIEMKGRFIHIRYFPVYDESGAYRGTLEVSQDATALRALKGERRLLDWDN